MIKARLVKVALAVLVISIIPLCASAEEHLALVIGNAAYPSSPLRNPANDAADVAAALRDLGIEGAPTFFVNGQRVVGFQSGRISELLK